MIAQANNNFASNGSVIGAMNDNSYRNRLLVIRGFSCDMVSSQNERQCKHQWSSDVTANVYSPSL